MSMEKLSPSEQKLSRVLKNLFLEIAGGDPVRPRAINKMNLIQKIVRRMIRVLMEDDFSDEEIQAVGRFVILEDLMNMEQGFHKVA